MIKSHLKVIGLDFDGTLVDSNKIKDLAFEEIFSEWPEHLEFMMQWHLNRNNIDRREKFRYFVEKVLVHPENQQLIDRLSAKFTRLTREAIEHCPMIVGAQDFLDFFFDKVPLFLVSATPQDELDGILQRRNMLKYFKRTYGAPIDKVKVLKQIMTSEYVSPDEILYIGDSPEDQQAAVSLGIHFIGKQSDRPLSAIKNKIFFDFLKIKNYTMKYFYLS